MPLIKHEAIFYASGENAGTYSLFCLKADFDGDMEKTVLRCISFDNDGKTEVPYYEAGTVRIPDFWGFEEYKGKHIKLRFAIARAGEEAISVLETPAQLEKFLSMEGTDQYIFGELHKRKVKNDFYNSLYNQFLNFLNGQSQYKSPFSQAQYSALSKCRINAYEVRYIDNKEYWNRGRNY
jgi:hypothetical protein